MMARDPVSVISTKTMTVGQLSAAEREHLGPALVDIVLESFAFPDKQIILDRVVFRDPAAKLHLLYRANGSIAGFVSQKLSRIRAAGREHAVINMGMYSSPDLRRTREYALAFLLAEVARFKLRHPRTPLCFVGEATSPAAYRAATTLRGLHPRRDAPTPEHLTELVRAVVTPRGMAPVDGDPWRVSVGLPFGFRDRERIERYVDRSTDPDVHFFVARNPGYLKGDWLVVYAPLDARHLLRMGTSFLRRQISRKLPRLRFPTRT